MTSFAGEILSITLTQSFLKNSPFSLESYLTELREAIKIMRGSSSREYLGRYILTINTELGEFPADTDDRLIV